MERIRKYYIQKTKIYGDTFEDIEEILPSIVMPRTWLIMYPLFPITMMFAFIASVCFGLFIYFQWSAQVYAAIIFIISYMIFILIAKADRTR